MSVLSGTYIFYADVYFMQNFIIKIAVLYLSLYCNKYYFHLSTIKGIGKIVLASAMGTLIEIAGLILGNSYNVFLILVHIFEIPLMTLIVLGKEMQSFIKVIVTGYFFVMVTNGVLEVLWNWFGESGNYIFFLCAACGFVYVAVRIWKNYSRMKKGTFPVVISHNEKIVNAYGFYDSGNRLVDPYTGRGVHIVSKKLLHGLGLEHETPVFVPYEALGKEDGMIEVYYVEELMIEGEKQRIHRQKCPIGVTEEKLFKEKEYEIILNEEVF